MVFCCHHLGEIIYEQSSQEIHNSSFLLLPFSTPAFGEEVRKLGVLGIMNQIVKKQLKLCNLS